MPRIVDADAERARLLEAIYEHVASRGFGVVRMRALAKHCGVSVGKLYHYFPDRDAIGQQLFAWAGARDIEDALRLLGEDPDGDRLALLFRYVERRGGRLGTTLVLALDHQRQHPEDPATRNALRLYQQALQTELGLAPEQADLLFTLLLGLLVRMRLDPERLDLDTHLGALRGGLDSAQCSSPSESSTSAERSIR